MNLLERICLHLKRDEGGNDECAKIYTVHYQLHGKPKSFVVRAEVMNNAEAWHWAAVDADIAHVSRIGRVGHEQVKNNRGPGRKSTGSATSPG